MKITVYNTLGKEAGTADLPDGIFALPWNADLVWQIATSQEANMRGTYAKTKDRAEVRGGGKKPWRQKGTGRARHGSIRSPLWKGGGSTHGPLTVKSYKKKINKKMARKALYTVLSAKARDNELVVLDLLKMDIPKTKKAAEIFSGLATHFKDITASKSRALVLLPHMDVNAKRAVRNLPYAAVDEARNLTAWQALQHKYLVLPKEAIVSFT